MVGLYTGFIGYLSRGVDVEGRVLQVTRHRGSTLAADPVFS